MRGPNAPSSVGERKYISTNNFNSIYMIPAHINLVSSVKYEPVYGRYLVSSSYDTFCKVWAYQSWAPVRSLEGHEGKVMALDVSPDGNYFASASYDRTFKLWATEASSPS
eukprot:Sdes_comp15997_c0_seq4m5173